MDREITQGQRGCDGHSVRLQVALDLFNKVLLDAAFQNKDSVDTGVQLRGTCTD